MGVERIVFYSVRCNICNSPLENWTGELARLTDTRAAAEIVALENGFEQKGKNTWICPDCKSIRTRLRKKL